MEVRTTQRLPPAMRTAFNVAAVTMAFTDGRAAIGAWLELLAQWLLSAGKWHHGIARWIDEQHRRCQLDAVLLLYSQQTLTGSAVELGLLPIALVPF